MTVYYDHDQVQDGAFPAILAIGDSWFWYPVASNLLAEISAVAKPAYSNILALGYLGAALDDYVNGKYVDQFAMELEPAYAKYYSAILISGGGNDVVDWSLCLSRNCQSYTTADQCIDKQRLEDLTTSLSGDLLAIVSEIHIAFDDAKLSRPDIFIHCYDYAPPNGIGFSDPVFNVSLKGPWLAPAMDLAGVPQDYPLRQAIVRQLIDPLTSTFLEFDSPSDDVHIINSPGTLDPTTDWANELHPNGQGFRKLVFGPWLRVLRAAGYST
jgi:hypothetical protein